MLRAAGVAHTFHEAPLEHLGEQIIQVDAGHDRGRVLGNGFSQQARHHVVAAGVSALVARSDSGAGAKHDIRYSASGSSVCSRNQA